MEYPNDKRSVTHRMIKARAPQGPGQPGQGTGEPSGGGGGGGGGPRTTVRPSTIENAPTTDRSPPPSTLPPPPPPTTTQRPPPVVSSSRTSVPPTTPATIADPVTSTPPTSSSIPAETTISTSPTSSITSITSLTPSIVRGQTSSFRSVSPTTLDGGSTISASSTETAKASGGIKTGAIVGGIGGGIIGMALLIFLITFILRRWRRRADKADRFHNDDFRRSAILMDDAASTNGNTTFNPRPPTMIERRMASHNVAPSIGAAEYPAVPIQPQQQYVYGQDPYAQQGDAYYDGEGSQSEAHGGAYSTDPQAQAVYDAEAYGSYVAHEQYAYSNEEHPDAQQNMTESEPTNMAGRGARSVGHDDSHNAYGGGY